jgi:putative sterol carrier protein
MEKLRSIDDVIASMETRFHPEACRSISASYQWMISGNGGRHFCVQIHNGTFRVANGVLPDPSVTFQTDIQTYLRLVNGDIKGMTAILTRKLNVRGNIYLASKMDNIFK